MILKQYHHHYHPLASLVLEDLNSWECQGSENQHHWVASINFTKEHVTRKLILKHNFHQKAWEKYHKILQNETNWQLILFLQQNKTTLPLVSYNTQGFLPSFRMLFTSMEVSFKTLLLISFKRFCLLGFPITEWTSLTRIAVEEADIYQLPKKAWLSTWLVNIWTTLNHFVSFC